MRLAYLSAHSSTKKGKKRKKVEAVELPTDSRDDNNRSYSIPTFAKEHSIDGLRHIVPECRWDRVCMRRFYLPAIPLPSIFPSADLAAASTIQMSNFLSIPRYLSPQSIVMCRRQHIVAEVIVIPRVGGQLYGLYFFPFFPFFRAAAESRGR